MNIIVTGNPSDGFIFIGPFANGVLATEYILKHPKEVRGDFWIFPLSRPRHHPDYINKRHDNDK